MKIYKNISMIEYCEDILNIKLLNIQKKIISNNKKINIKKGRR